MPAHAQVVVAAPYGDLLVASGAFCRHWERCCIAAHFTEDAVRVILFLLLYLPVEELLVVEDGLAGGLCGDNTGCRVKGWHRLLGETHGITTDIRTGSNQLQYSTYYAYMPQLTYTPFSISRNHNYCNFTSLLSRKKNLVYAYNNRFFDIFSWPNFVQVYCSLVVSNTVFHFNYTSNMVKLQLQMYYAVTKYIHNLLT